MKNTFNFSKASLLTKEDQKNIKGGLDVRYCAHATHGGLEVRLYTGVGSGACDIDISCLGCWWETL